MLEYNMPVYLKNGCLTIVMPVLHMLVKRGQAKRKLRTAQRGMNRAMLGYTRRGTKMSDYIRSVSKVNNSLVRMETSKWR